jgi:hypothetical protein
VPEVDLSPDQAPDAVQDEASVLDHVIVVDSSTITVVGLADIDAVAGVVVFPPPSLELLELEPPPPQADNNNAIGITNATEDLKMLDIYTSIFR